MHINNIKWLYAPLCTILCHCNSPFFGLLRNNYVPFGSESSHRQVDTCWWGRLFVFADEPTNHQPVHKPLVQGTFWMFLSDFGGLGLSYLWFTDLAMVYFSEVPTKNPTDYGPCTVIWSNPKTLKDDTSLATQQDQDRFVAAAAATILEQGQPWEECWSPGSEFW